MRGIADLKMQATAAGREVLGYPAEEVTVHYHNGPLLVPADNPAIPDFEPLSLFRTETAKKALHRASW